MQLDGGTVFRAKLPVIVDGGEVFPIVPGYCLDLPVLHLRKHVARRRLLAWWHEEIEIGEGPEAGRRIGAACE